MMKTAPNQAPGDGASAKKLAEIRSVIKQQAEAGNRTSIMLYAADAVSQAFYLPMKEAISAAAIIRDGRQYLDVNMMPGGTRRELADSPAKIAACQILTEAAAAVGSTSGPAVPPGMAVDVAYNSVRSLWRSLGGRVPNGASMRDALRASKAAAMTQADPAGAVVTGRGGVVRVEGKVEEDGELVFQATVVKRSTLGIVLETVSGETKFTFEFARHSAPR